MSYPIKNGAKKINEMLEMMFNEMKRSKTNQSKSKQTK
jgi:hypothetical protein